MPKRFRSCSRTSRTTSPASAVPNTWRSYWWCTDRQLKAFHAALADPAVKQAVSNIKEEGVSLDACANTMAAQKVDEKGLLPGFVKVDQGGVVRIAQLQGDGYVYLRP